MTAHLLIPELDRDLPATLSPQILTHLLRKELGFDGLIVTDALVMGAIADRYGANEAAVLAIAAGADIVLMPVNPPGALKAICAAVDEGRIAAAQIRASLERVWRAKTKALASQIPMGNSPHAWETVPPPLQIHQISRPKSLSAVDEILQASQQASVLQALTLEPGGVYRNLLVVDQALDCKDLGGYAPAIARPKQLGYQLQVVDSFTPDLHWETDIAKIPMTLLQVFIRGNPFRGSSGLNQAALNWFQYLRTRDRLHAIVIYGSPYVLDQFLTDLPVSIPYVFTYGQTLAAQTQALNLLFPGGVPQNALWIESAAF
jgi:beta-glucosidase